MHALRGKRIDPARRYKEGVTPGQCMVPQGTGGIKEPPPKSKPFRYNRTVAEKHSACTVLQETDPIKNRQSRLLARRVPSFPNAVNVFAHI